MEFIGFIYLLIGSTFGLILRIFVKYISRRKIVFALNDILIVNVLASLFLGISIALNINNKNLLLFFSIGFLGCFSTFSSFIYQLFNLIQKRKYLRFLLYYFEVFGLTFIFFYLGYFITNIFKN